MEPTGKVPLQTLRKRAGTFKEYLAGVWTDLFITVYQDSITVRETLTITGKMMARKVDFRIQRTAKQTI